MRELGIVAGVSALMCLLSGIWFTPWETLYYNGIWLVAAGFLVGVPTGFIYHVRLYRVLAPRGELPPRWYWKPLRFNVCLRREERPGVMVWCYVGGLGFLVICVGLLMMGAGVSMALIQGVDTLVKAVLENEIGKQGNVHAELGSTWRFVMTRPDAAAHVLGKLLLYLGEDRILWGTDSIWYGTPQDQISAFRAFEIPVSMQEMYGYPALSAEAKAKILGLNAAEVYGIDVAATRCAIAEDDLSKAKLAIEEDPVLRRPSYRRAGPQSRREFLTYLRLHEGQPG